MNDTRIVPLPLADATPEARAVLDRVRKEMGMLPNVYRVLAHSPAVLEGYDAEARMLDRASLPRRVREQIALMTASLNSCDYCLAAHRVAGRMAKLSHAEITAAELGDADDPGERIVLQLAREMLEQRGDVSDATMETARAAGVTDAEMVEIAAHVAINVFTNTMNRLARTPIDFGRVARVAAEMSARFTRG